MAVSGAGRGAGGELLLLRRDGALWGIASDAVHSLRRDDGGYRIEAAGFALAADEVLGVVPGLAVHPLAAAVRRFFPGAGGAGGDAGGRGPVAGLAVYGELPVLVVNPLAPPGALIAPEVEPIGGEVADGE